MTILPMLISVTYEMRILFRIAINTTFHNCHNCHKLYLFRTYFKVTHIRIYNPK